eukprot:s803_g13.t1
MVATEAWSRLADVQTNLMLAVTASQGAQKREKLTRGLLFRSGLPCPGLTLMSTNLPEISGSRSPEGRSLKKNSLNSKFLPTSQARFGYLGHLCLQNTKDDPTEALRNITALDAPSFLPNVMTLQRASTPWQYNTPCRTLEAACADDSAQGEEAAGPGGSLSPSRGNRASSQKQQTNSK